MDIIPVIDLLDGNVVHAQRGQRSLYRPIQSPLCTGSSPLDIVQALLRLYPFTQLYIADLNAIQAQGDNADIIRQISTLHPQLDIWMDAGFGHAHEIAPWHAIGITRVLGSESMEDLAQYRALTVEYPEHTILSLDFSIHGYKGPVTLLESPALWPDKVIVMSLAQVGSNLGPDFERLEKVLNTACSKKKPCRVYAAGGARNRDDIMSLKTMGVAGALVATALHNGSITSDDIALVSTEMPAG